MARISQYHIPHGEYHGVVIIGAGIAGLTAARTLQDAGIQSLVLERENEMGGRCATLSFQGGLFDLGAQFFTVRRPEFQHVVDLWLEKGCARQWTRGFPEISGIAERESHPRYCGVAGMRDLAAALAAGLEVRTGTPVKRISEGRSCWLVHLPDQQPIKADVVVLTPPAPVSLRLISDENTWRMGALLLPIAGISYSPRIAVAAVLDGPSGLPKQGAARVDDSPVSWIADNQIKGISPVPAVTIHATPAFCAAHRETSPEETGTLLLEAARPHLKSAVIAYCTHTWACGAPDTTFPRPCYLVEGRAPLVFAGDSFSGGLVEGAACSGMMAARMIIERRQALPNQT